MLLVQESGSLVVVTTPRGSEFVPQKDFTIDTRGRGLS